MHQHFNASDTEDLISLVMKAKPLFLFMHMLFQKVAEYLPKEFRAGLGTLGAADGSLIRAIPRNINSGN